MKIIEKVLSENPSFTKFEIIAGTCPSRWGYKNTTHDQCEKSIDTCAKCWNREVEESTKDLQPTTRNLDEGLKNNNLAQMSKKLCEEAVEVVEAAINYSKSGARKDIVNLTQELLDVAQMTLNIINFVNSGEELSFLENQIKEHNKKLLERGWEWDSNLHMKILEGESNE